MRNCCPIYIYGVDYNMVLRLLCRQKPLKCVKSNWRINCNFTNGYISQAEE